LLPFNWGNNDVHLNPMKVSLTLIRGRISIAWSQIMARHYRTSNMKSEYNADRWNQAIIQALWDIFDSQWTTQNSVNIQDAQEKALTRLTILLSNLAATNLHDTIQNSWTPL
jgi:hypothetical protein